MVPYGQSVRNIDQVATAPRLIDGIVVMPRAAGGCLKAGMTKAEKAKKHTADQTGPGRGRGDQRRDGANRCAGSANPHPGGCGALRVVAKIGCWPSKGAGDPVGEVGVAAGEHLGEQVAQQFHLDAGYAARGQACGELARASHSTRRF